jgi:hypothetical protein
MDQCHVAGTCDPSTGLCSNPNATDGTVCNDSNACTQTDTCQSGTCTGTNFMVCTPMDQCHVAGICDPSTGQCSNPKVTDGTVCNDNNACTQTDTCQSGTCTGTNSIVCTPMDQCHVGICDPLTGQCSNPNATDGTACSNLGTCLLSGSCMAGSCTGTACASALCGTSLSAFTGTQTPGWQLNGNANYDLTANTVVLADGLANGEAGTAIYQDAITVDSFTVSFDFKATTQNPYSRADGIAFMIETNSNTSVGAGYGGFGVMGLQGYAVELDLFDSGPCDPGNGNHAGVDLLSACSTNGGILSPIATSNDLFDGALPGNGVGDIGDGIWRTATIQMVSGQVSVMITGASGPVAVGNLQGVTLPGFVSGTPHYFGFGAGTGSNSLAARQEIRNVQITFPTQRCL